MPLTANDLPAGLWSVAVPIRFGHCDAAGIVYTPNYFDLFNGVIEDWHPGALGIDYHGLLTQRRIGLGYGHASCEFLVPSRMGEVLQVAVRVERIGRSSFTLVLHAMKGGREAVRGRFISVATSLDTHAVTPIPPDLRAAIEAYQERCDRPGDG